jgi:hypothetical protein
MREHGFLLACAIAAFILVAASVSVLAVSYRNAGISRFSEFVAEHQGGECGKPTVVAALLSAAGKSPRASQDAVYRVTQAWAVQVDPEGDTHILLRAQRLLWARTIFSREEVLRAFCALGSPGPKRTLERVGSLVGITRISTAPKDELQSLADVYVFDMRIWREPKEIQCLYQSRLRRIHSGPDMIYPCILNR